MDRPGMTVEELLYRCSDQQRVVFHPIDPMRGEFVIEIFNSSGEIMETIVRGSIDTALLSKMDRANEVIEQRLLRLVIQSQKLSQEVNESGKKAIDFNVP